jgi:oligoribonuclease NrnB/cAMP/cGMP phosphodiesterase (DHH superfamily)
MKSIVVLYHSNCPDGFSAAWAAWKKFGNKVSYIPVEPQTLPKTKIKNSEVYIIDSSYPKTFIQKLLKNKNFVTIIDHHISAREDAKNASQWHFDLNHSGSVLAWQYFHPDKRLPKLLRYIEDVDLWRFKLPHTEEILAGIQFLDQNFKTWEKLVRDFEKQKTFKKYIAEGGIILRYENEVIRRIISRAGVVAFAGSKVLAVNSPILNSEIGHILSKKKPPFSIIWYQSRDKIHISLRSNGKVDVSKIAKRFGGGGHKAAAAFSIPLNKKLPWKIIK